MYFSTSQSSLLGEILGDYHVAQKISRQWPTAAQLRHAVTNGHHSLPNTVRSVLQASFELADRSCLLTDKEDFFADSSDAMRKFFKSRLGHLEREVMAVMFCDNKHRVLEVADMFQGTVNKANLYYREIVKKALELNAAAIVLSHNHPSGETIPSQSDIAMTKNLKRQLDMLDIRLLDHIVVAGNESSSMSEDGYMAL